MKTLRLSRRWALLPTIALLVAAAQANVGSGSSTSSGTFEGINYGSSGNVSELEPYLFVNLVGTGDKASTVTGKNTSLDFSFSTVSAPNLLTIEYRITHLGIDPLPFNDLRFMVWVNPDGDQTDFIDRVSEAWVAPNVNDPVLRQFSQFGADPTLPSAFRINNNLTDGAPTGVCATAAGCDALYALQWNAAVINPGESFVVQVGLSDNGTSLSSRFLTASSVLTPGTALTFSGTGEVVAVPEPATWLMAASGLLLLGAAARRRSA